MPEGANVPIEEGELILALVEPGEVPSGVHQPHQEEPGPAPLACEVDRDLAEVDLRPIAGAMDQRHVDPGAPPSPLAQIRQHGRQPDLVALVPQRPEQPPAGDALLRRGAPRPLLEQLLKPRPHLLQQRTRPLPLPEPRLRVVHQ